MSMQNQQPNQQRESVLKNDAARAAFARLTCDVELSVPQRRFFDDCEDALIILTDHGFLAARRAPQKLFSRNAHRCTEIGLVYVQPEHRGNGHAAALLDVLERAAETELLAVYAQTCIHSPTMARLYRGRGYKAVFSTPQRHAAEALSDPAAWIEPNAKDFDGTRTAVLVKRVSARQGHLDERPVKRVRIARLAPVRDQLREPCKAQLEHL